MAETPSVVTPRTLEEALAAMAHSPGALPVQGGTEVMVALHHAQIDPPVLIDMSRVRETQQFRDVYAVDAAVTSIGAAVTLAELAGSGDGLSPLSNAAASIASHEVRNLGTVGGNLGSSRAEGGDLLPALLCLDATIEVVDQDGPRQINARDWARDRPPSAHRKPELIRRVLVRRGTFNSAFTKLGRRRAFRRALLVGCALADRTSGVARIAAAGPGLRATRCEEAEARLADALTATRAAIGTRLSSTFEDVGRLVLQDLESSPGVFVSDYQRVVIPRVMAGLVRKALGSVRADASGG